MTLRAFVAQAQKLYSLQGEVCVQAKLGFARTLMLDFAGLLPPDERGYQQPERSLVAECSWRLESENEVVVGSGDSLETIRPKLQVCIGERVIEISVFRPSFMVQLRLTGGLAFWIFPDDSREYVSDSEYPHAPWYLAGHAFPSDWEEM